MSIKHLLFISCFLLLGAQYSFGTNAIDSLTAVYEDSNYPDSTRIQALDQLVWKVVFNNPDSARVLAFKLLSMGQNANDTGVVIETYNKIGISHYFMSSYDSALWYYDTMVPLIKAYGNEKKLFSVYNNTALVYVDKGDYSKALEMHQTNLELKKSMGLEKVQAKTLLNIGVIQSKQNNIPSAIEYLLNALRIAEKFKDQSTIASANQSLGSCFTKLEDYAQALKRTNNALKIYSSMNRTRDMAHCYNTLGNIQSKLKNHDKALLFHKKGLDLRLKIGDPESIGSTLNEIALVYESKEQYDTSVVYYQKAIAEFNKSEYNLGLSDSYVGLGQIELKRRRWRKASEYCLKGFDLAEETNTISDDCNCLFKAYKGMGKYKVALQYHERYKALKDSMFNHANTEEITRLQLNHEFAKEQLKDSIEFASQQELKDLEIEKQQAQLEKDKLVQYSLFGGLGLVLVFALLIARSLQQTRTQKRVVEEQKAIVDEKNTEILDSINYAKRIQNALLTTESRRLEWLRNSFIYYVPKDIVAGDFYWMQKVGANILVAACDCTGHGVPGAMVSVVCFNALNRSVNEFKLKDPAQILDKTRELVKETFSESEEDVKDGMDASLVSYNPSTGEMSYAGANHTMYRIGQNGLEQVKGDKQPIGTHIVESPFNTHKIQLEKNEMVYLFSDGYADQFGGPDGKKYMYKKFRNYLLSIKDGPLTQQKEDLALELNRWMGDVEQVDDICIIGIKHIDES